jgi:hypothetical protein
MASIRERLAQVESNNNPQAVNEKSSAVGKHQFLWNTWGDEIREFSGEEELTKEDFAEDETLQDKFFDHYQMKELAPQAQRLAKATGSQLPEDELQALIHFKGYGDALKILKGGDDPTAEHNAPVSEYLQKFRRAIPAERKDDPMFSTPLDARRMPGQEPKLPSAEPVMMASALDEANFLSSVSPNSGGATGTWGEPEPSTLKKRVAAAPTGVGPVADGEKYAAQVESFQKKVDAAPMAAAEKKDIKEKTKTLEDLFAEGKKSLENRELAERVGHALAQLGAGLHGLQTGTDMSGLKFQKSDWDKKMDNLISEFRERNRKAEVQAKKDEKAKAKQEKADATAKGKTEKATEESVKQKKKEVAQLRKAANMLADKNLDADKAWSQIVKLPHIAKQVETLQFIKDAHDSDKAWQELMTMIDTTEKTIAEAAPVAAGAQSPFPRQVRKGNKVAMVADQAELDEAAADGWK